MKGIIAFYINRRADSPESIVPDTIAGIQKQNATLLDKLTKEGYEIAFIPITGEATRMERILFEERN
jgi:hypothetical protein